MNNTGTKRSLTVTITKKRDGVTVTGYPKTYNGLNMFITPDSTIFPTITESQLSVMTEGNFSIRYEKFVEYVENAESKLNFDTANILAEAIINDSLDCLT